MKLVSLRLNSQLPIFLEILEENLFSFFLNLFQLLEAINSVSLSLFSFLLEYNCFTVLLVFAVQWSESAMCIYTSSPSWTSLPLHPHPPIQVITEHLAELPVLSFMVLCWIYKSSKVGWILMLPSLWFSLFCFPLLFIRTPVMCQASPVIQNNLPITRSAD